MSIPPIEHFCLHKANYFFLHALAGQIDAATVIIFLSIIRRRITKKYSKYVVLLNMVLVRLFLNVFTTGDVTRYKQ